MKIAATLALALLTAGRAWAAACDPTGADAAAIADARQDVADHCTCATAASHGAYVSCAAGIITGRAHTGRLNPSCTAAVKRCAARSTCGHPGFVTCCRTRRTGKKSCVIKREASKCRALAGGSASVGSQPSCCDACAGGGGPGDPVCGDGITQAGELCDELGGASQACPDPDGKRRCARPGEAGACQRCCGRSVGDLGTGLICVGDDMCCGFCAIWGPSPASRRCADCLDATCSCGHTGDVCNETSCCAGYSCRVNGNFAFANCCAEAGTGCGSPGDCCSGTCTAGVCE